MNSEEKKQHEKLVRAKVKLESLQMQHSSECALETDPDYRGPCTCGASKHNEPINIALKVLKDIE